MSKSSLYNINGNGYATSNTFPDESKDGGEETKDGTDRDSPPTNPHVDPIHSTLPHSMYQDYNPPSVIIGEDSSSSSKSKRSYNLDTTTMTIETGTETCDFLQNTDVGSQVIINKGVECQTDEVVVGEGVSVSVVRKRKGKGKGESKEEGKGGDGDGKEGDDENYDDDEAFDDDDDKLSSQSSDAASTSILSFLKSVTPLMLEELASNLESQAFENYSQRVDAETGPVKQLYSLTFSQSKIVKHRLSMAGGGYTGGGGFGGFGDRDSSSNDTSNNNDEGLEATAVAFNSSGSIICATYGSTKSKGWCNASGYLVAWNLSSRKFSPDDEPMIVLEHSSYLMCVAGHPDKPNIFVAGSFNGEVLVYDVTLSSSSSSTDSDSQPLMFCSKIDDYFHREPILSLCWSWDIFESEWQLCSVGGDGKVLYWSFNNKLKCPLRGLVVCDPKLKKDDDSGRNVGATALAAHTYDRMASMNDMWVGSEGGAIIRLYARDSVVAKPPKVSACEMKWSSNALQALHRVPVHRRDEVCRKVERKAKSDKRRGVDLVAVYAAKLEPQLLFQNTANFVYDPHVGPVKAINASPFYKKIFASAGNDGEVRMYYTLSKAPLAVFEPCAATSHGGGAANDIQWSKTRPMVFGVADSNGFVHLYDLSKDDQMPVASLEGKMLEGGGVGYRKKAEDGGEDGGGGGGGGAEDGDEGGGNHQQQNVVQQPVDYTGTTLPPSSMHSLCFNGRIRNLVAACDGNGVVHVWRMPGDLADGRGGGEEAKMLEEFVDTRLDS
jgi:hypothetical protein